jgi:hypothetical protein
MAQENSAPEAPQERSAHALIRANGCRRINLDMRARLDEADRYTGLPRGTAKPYTYLAGFAVLRPQSDQAGNGRIAGCNRLPQGLCPEVDRSIGIVICKRKLSSVPDWRATERAHTDGSQSLRRQH